MTLALARALKGGACAALFVLVLFTALPCFGATWTVTNTLDDGAGSLREALGRASSGDVINITATGEITLASALEIKGIVTINGTGPSNLAISGNNTVPVFYISDDSRVILTGMTIRNGSGSAAGGIYNRGDTLTVIDCTITANGGEHAGGIYNLRGSVNVNHSTISNNSGTTGAGGIYSQGASVFVANSTVSGNGSSGGAGGIEDDGGPRATLTVTNSTVAGNFGSFAGGILILKGTLTVTNSTLVGNSRAAGYGGGGGFSNHGSTTLKNSLLANNSGGNCYGPGIISSHGHNLSDDGTCSGFFTQIGDRNNTVPGLDPAGLKNNGGLTPTIALLPTSSAVDAIPLTPTDYCTALGGASPITTDQRGVARPQGSGCDIGAFELAQTPTTVPFSSLSARLDFTREVFSRPPSFDLDATFILGPRNNGIQPLSEPVTLQLGPYNFAIPAGSFRQYATGSLFVGDIGGVSLQVEITPEGAERYHFRAIGSPVNLAAFQQTPTVTVGITIGNDTGTAAVAPNYF